MAKKRRFFPFVHFLLLAAYFSFSGIIYARQPGNDYSSLNNESRPVERYGQLKVEGSRLLGENGIPVVLRGMSLFWSQWIGKYYNYDCMKWLRDDWKCSVVRAAMGVESGGYLTNPETEKEKIIKVIDACLSLGVYVIVDWHDRHAEKHTNAAVNFFREIAKQYGDNPNIIYEIFHEPEDVSWNDVVKPYADSLIKCIREFDPDNIIIVPTPYWCQDVDQAVLNPLKYNNIVYAFHFYAATHKQYLRNKAEAAIKSGLPLFVSEWGTCESSQDGIMDYTELNYWINFMARYNLSWCNWAISDKVETSATLVEGTEPRGEWKNSDLTESGRLVRNLLRQLSDSLSTGVDYVVDPGSFILEQNYPNPFNPETKFNFNLETTGYVTLKVYNTLGQEITTLIDEVKTPGNYSIGFNGSFLSSGAYIARLSSGGKTVSRKISLIK